MLHVRDVVFNVSNFHPLSIERLRHLRRFHLLFRRFVLILLLRLLVIPSGAVERGRSRHVERGSRRISPAVRVHPPAFRQRFSHRRRRFGIVGRALRSSRSRAVYRLVSSNCYPFIPIGTFTTGLRKTILLQSDDRSLSPKRSIQKTQRNERVSKRLRWYASRNTSGGEKTKQQHKRL